MRFHALFAGLAAFAVAAAPLAAQAQSQAQTQTAARAPAFTPEAFRAHVTFLADDLLEGREAGTRGFDIAARYVAAQFEALGLTPGARGSWFQEVPFLSFAMTGEPAALVVGGQRFVHGRDLIMRQSPEQGRAVIEAPLVFAGYGLDMPARGFDDYRGLDVAGKIVVVLSGTPAGLPSDVAAHLGNDKRRAADRRGAVGLITIARTADADGAAWARSIRHLPGPGLTWVGPDGVPFSDAPGLRFVASASPAMAEALFRGAPRPLARTLAEAARPGVRPRGFALRETVRLERESAGERLTSPNVLAILPGTDPALANEYVLLMAHLDGLGIAPGEGPEVDRIRNGAMDNATGVATLIEVARQIVQSGQRPRRPILLAAVTAEEKGLLGAQYLARNPVVDGEIVAVVNLDMPILTYDFTDVIAFGAEHSTMGPIVRRAARGMSVALSDDPLPEEGLFTRSDHYMFVREGVPSVFLMTGFAGEGEREFRGFLATHYHRPSDDLNLPFNWQAGAKFAELNYRIAREIADADERPLWYRDSFFGDAFAGDQPRAARGAN
jgi:hypothetical protein